MPDVNITLNHKFQKITLTGTDVHVVNFDAMLNEGGSIISNGEATLELLSGASVQASPNAPIDANAGTIVTANPRCVIDIRRGTPLRLKGGAGSEALNVSIFSK